MIYRDEFFPTPLHIIEKMVNGINFEMINSVLEPSAGKGDIVKRVAEKLKYGHNVYGSNVYTADIDCIEIDEKLRHILKGYQYRVVHDDFLTYDTFKQYDLIIMNPPFSNADQHILKALEIQKDGGIIISLLNAETLMNPYTNTRKDLTRKLNELNAEISYINGAFKDSERKTDVDIAIVKVNIPKVQKPSYIYEQLRQEQKYKQTDDIKDEYYSLIQNDFIKAAVDQYKLEIQAGLNLIKEYNAMKPYILKSFNKEDSIYNDSILNLGFPDSGRYAEKLSINAFIKRVRYKYWYALFNNDTFTGVLTENLRRDYFNRIDGLCEYDFTMYNIYSIRLEMNKNMIKGIEDTILNLFDEFSHKYNWFDESSKNIHYFNGWKTNQSWCINKKIILPMKAFRDMEYSWGCYDPLSSDVIYKLEDIEKVFNYLDGGLTDDINIKETLKQTKETGQTTKIKLKYFNITFYKKGTAHIEFTNLDLLQKFNLYGSQRKGWLPPSYGKAKYKDMSREEQTVIDEFEGKESYEKVMNNKQYYIVESSELLKLGA